MKLAAVILLALTTAACASSASAPAEGGYASYDALRQLQADCAAKGGTLKLKTLGDAQSIDAYACKRN